MSMIQSAAVLLGPGALVGSAAAYAAERKDGGSTAGGVAKGSLIVAGLATAATVGLVIAGNRRPDPYLGYALLAAATATNAFGASMAAGGVSLLSR